MSCQTVRTKEIDLVALISVHAVLAHAHSKSVTTQYTSAYSRPVPRRVRFLHLQAIEGQLEPRDEMKYTGT